MEHKDIFLYPQPEVYAPLPETICFGVIGLAHGHIYDMCYGLIQQGALLKYVYDPDAGSVRKFCDFFPQVHACTSEDEVLEKTDIQLILSADIPAHRADIGIRAMQAGKDFYVDKAPMTTLEQVAAVRRACAETGRKCFVYYGESVVSSSAIYARDLIARGIVGQVLYVEGMAPHRLNPPNRSDWFFQREKTGGILIDLVCHQLHQFLTFTDTTSATVDMGRVANYAHPEYPDWDDFGDCACTAANGATGHFRVDWFTPDGLQSGGDSRMWIVGTDGYIELRKNRDITRNADGCDVYVVTHQGEFCDNVNGKVPITFPRKLLEDCIYRTDSCANPEQVFQAISLAIQAQMMALSNLDTTKNRTG